MRPLTVRILTNNPLVRLQYPGAEWVEGPPENVLTAVRDSVHKGHGLLLHPSLGNLRPRQAYYRSFVISARAEVGGAPASIFLLEDALEVLRGSGPPPSPPERVTADLQAIDYDLLTTGLRRLHPSHYIPEGRTNPCA